MDNHKVYKLRFKVKNKESTCDCFYLNFSHQENLKNVYRDVSKTLEETYARVIDISLHFGKSNLEPSEKSLNDEGLVSGDTVFVHFIGEEPPGKERKDETSSGVSVQDSLSKELQVPQSNIMSVDWSNSDSVKKLMDQHQEFAATYIDRLALMLHKMLMESGFQVSNPHPDNRFLPAEWQWRSGTKVLQYGLKMDDQMVPVKVVMIEVGASLAVHGTVLGKRITYVIKSPSRFGDLHHTRELAVSFKNQFVRLLLYASGCNVAQLSYFPDEVILKIARSLDYKSALKWSQTASHFTNILRDNRLWRFYYERDYPKTYGKRSTMENPDWFKLYKEETVAVRALRKSRDYALAIYLPPVPEPFIDPRPPIFPPLLPDLPGPFGPPILPDLPGPFGPPILPDMPFVNRDIQGLGGNYEERHIGDLHPRRRHDFGALGRPPGGGRFGGGFGAFL